MTALVFQLAAPVTALAIDEPVVPETALLENSPAVVDVSDSDTTVTTTDTDTDKISETSDIVAPETATIVATKIICDVETDLPNWGSTNQAIDATTATQFLLEHPNCRAAEGWNFQWSQDADSPGDNKQMGTTGWNTFGLTGVDGTTSTTVPLASNISVRTEVRAGYINFSGIDDHHNGVSAEMLCGAPTVAHRYDNRENIGDASNGGTFYCVSLVAVTPSLEPISPSQCDLVSDTTNKIKYPDQNAVETWVHPNWAPTAPLGGLAKWIWTSFKVGDPAHDRTLTFLKTFSLDTIPTNATIEIAADNGYIIRVNNDVIADKIPDEHNYEATVSYPVSNLKIGNNELKITVQNFGVVGSTAESNPAGLLYKLHINGSTCADPIIEQSVDSVKDDVVTPAITASPSTSRSIGTTGSFMIRPNTLGEVLGASTESVDTALAQCDEYLHSYIKVGQKNNAGDVVRLQTFLNQYLGVKLLPTGIYDNATYDALRKFQVQTSGDVLIPWKATPGGINEKGTGYVYKTTKRMINMIKCPALNIAMPVLN